MAYQTGRTCKACGDALPDNTGYDERGGYRSTQGRPRLYCDATCRSRARRNREWEAMTRLPYCYRCPKRAPHTATVQGHKTTQVHACDSCLPLLRRDAATFGAKVTHVATVDLAALRGSVAQERTNAAMGQRPMFEPYDDELGSERRDGNTPCEHCGHPEAVHGGFARPRSRCAYRGCDCQGYVPSPAKARKPRVASSESLTVPTCKRCQQRHHAECTPPCGCGSKVHA